MMKGEVVGIENGRVFGLKREDMMLVLKVVNEFEEKRWVMVRGK